MPQKLRRAHYSLCVRAKGIDNLVMLCLAVYKFKMWVGNLWIGVQFAHGHPPDPITSVAGQVTTPTRQQHSQA